MRTEAEIKEKLEYVKGNQPGSNFSYVQRALEWVLGGDDTSFLGTLYNEEYRRERRT